MDPRFIHTWHQNIIKITEVFHLTTVVNSCLLGNCKLFGGLIRYWLHYWRAIPLVVLIVLKWKLLSLNDGFWSFLQINLYICGNQLHSFGMSFFVLIKFHTLIDANQCHIWHMWLIQIFLKWLVIYFTDVIGLQKITNTNQLWFYLKSTSCFGKELKPYAYDLSVWID